MPVTLGNPGLALLPPGGRGEGAQLGDCQSILLFCTTTTTSLATQPQLGKMCFFYTLIELNHIVHLGIPGQPLPGTTCPKGVSTEPATSMKKVAVVLA